MWPPACLSGFACQDPRIHSGDSLCEGHIFRGLGFIWTLEAALAMMGGFQWVPRKAAGLAGLGQSPAGPVGRLGQWHPQALSPQPQPRQFPGGPAGLSPRGPASLLLSLHSALPLSPLSLGNIPISPSLMSPGASPPHRGPTPPSGTGWCRPCVRHKSPMAVSEESGPQAGPLNTPGPDGRGILGPDAAAWGPLHRPGRQACPWPWQHGRGG